MIDEEKAEEYLDKHKESTHIKGVYRITVDEKQIYLDGYEQGYEDCRHYAHDYYKPKWHDLREDPNNLPKRDKELSDQSIIVLNQNGHNVRYDFNLKYWHFLNDEEAIVIAWWERPKFKEM